MKNTLEKMWIEYFAEKCAVLDTDEERALLRKAADLHEKANALLNKEQQEAIEKYLDAFCDIESCFLKKAFSKGCEFATSFLYETVIAEKI